MEQWSEIHALITNREFKKAEIAIAKILRTDLPSQEMAIALLFRAKVRLQTNRHTETLEDLQQIRESNTLGNSPEYLEILGDTHFQRFEMATVGFADKNEVLAAQKAYEQIIKQAPHYNNMGWIYYQLGRVKLSLGISAEGEYYFKESFFKPSHVKSLTAFCFERLGFIALYETRDYRMALTLLDKAIATYPSTESPAWLIQAQILKSKVLQFLDLGQALQTAKGALQLVHQSQGISKQVLSEVLFTVADISSKSKGFEKEVIDHAQQFIQVSKAPIGIDVTWARVHEMLGDALLALGRYEQAVNAFNAVLQFNPYHPWENAIKLRIANCYFQLHNYQKVIEVIHQVINNKDVSEDYQAFELLGNTYYLMNRHDDARIAYHRALSLAPVGVNLSESRERYELVLKNQSSN